jgi:hypothetical protein
MADADNFDKRYKQYEEAQNKANELNKAAVFDVLAESGIQYVSVDFEGEGDDGQIEEVNASKNDQPVAMPESSLPFHVVAWGSETITSTTTPLSEAIERLCYDYLSQEHGGWENNDGGYGNFTFDVAARTINLDFNARYSDSTRHYHTF